MSSPPLIQFPNEEGIGPESPWTDWPKAFSEFFTPGGHPIGTTLIIFLLLPFLVA